MPLAPHAVNARAEVQVDALELFGGAVLSRFRWRTGSAPPRVEEDRRTGILFNT